MSMTFVDSVNRILRITGVIRGDTDAISTFSDLQHGATLNLCIIAIQDTLTDLMAFYDFPTERTSSSITFVTGTRAYSLPSDFVQFWKSNQFLYDATGSNYIYEYPGGEKALAASIFTYKSDTGSPNWWYYIEGSTKQLGMYQIPDSTFNGRTVTFDYEKDIVPILATDTMPFIRDIETNSFCQLAAIRFQAMFNANPKEPSAPIESHPQYINSRSTLLSLINPSKANKYYGAVYA
jgi:hypothetical protein